MTSKNKNIFSFLKQSETAYDVFRFKHLFLNGRPELATPSHLEHLQRVKKRSTNEPLRNFNQLTKTVGEHLPVFQQAAVLNQKERRADLHHRDPAVKNGVAPVKKLVHAPLNGVVQLVVKEL